MLDEASSCIQFEPAMVHLIDVKNKLKRDVPGNTPFWAKVFSDEGLEGAVHGHGAHLVLQAKGPWEALSADPPTERCPLHW